MTKMIAQAAAPASSPGFSPLILLMYALFIGGFYFLFIAPQKKKQKEHERMIIALQTGDEVITTGGIYGTITNVKDDRFVVRVADNTDRKSTRLNSSHLGISYAVFCLKKKKKTMKTSMTQPQT